MNRISIQANNSKYIAEIYSTVTGKAILESLPIRAKAITWGEEIYFSIPTSCDLEKDCRDILDVGELCYYPPMQAFCIFFGPTPISTDEHPRAADLVNVFGKITSSIKGLENVRSGDSIFIETVQ